jgi:TonB family protein
VWTVVMAGMLAMAALGPLLPGIPVRILSPAPPAAALPDVAASATAPASPAAPGVPLNQVPALRWQDIAAAVYIAGVAVLLVRLAFGGLFASRLVRASNRIGEPFTKDIFESAWISVPLTVGWLRPKILLPAGWRQWDRVKLDAVLAHERTHVARADWAIGVLAGLNRCVFWFHPLAWWLERRLAVLAEQACDDAALTLVPPESYARALLDMAAAVQSGHGRLVWEAMAMAKASEVQRRIERILDETRNIPLALTARRWAALAACALPLVYLASALRPAPAAAQQAVQTPTAINDLMRGDKKIGPGDVPALEQYLAGSPHDLNVRAQLIYYYYSAGIRDPRLSHIFWLIASHPESSQALVATLGLTPQTTALNDAADYQRAVASWRQQAAQRPNDARVLSNAAQILTASGGNFSEAERVLLALRQLSPSGGTWAMQLSRLYANAILGLAGDPAFPNQDPAFAQHAKSTLETSTNRAHVLRTTMTIMAAAVHPQPGGKLGPRTLNLDEHPLLAPTVQWAKDLLEKTMPGVPTVINGVIMTGPAAGSATGTPPAPLPPPPPPPSNLLHRVEPVYPPLARQARIQGDVRLTVQTGADGHVERMEVVSGHPLLVPSALEAVKQWTFAPGTAASMSLAVPFRLPEGAPAAGTAAPPPSDGVPAVVMGPDVYNSRLLHSGEPVYPPLARQARISGVVHLEITVGPDGRVENVKAQSGHPLLVPAAMEAVRQWTWAPTYLNGQPVRVTTTLSVPFALQP